MFDSIAPRYDLLNHTLSLNVDRWWRRRVVGEVRRGAPAQILDMATGTGDLAIELARHIPGAHVTGVDLSDRMLAEARRKVAAQGLAERIELHQGDAEHPTAEACYDAATVAFGVRNFGDLHAGLCGLARAIKPGAKSLYWSSRGRAAGCSGRCSGSIFAGFCRGWAGWSPTTAGPTTICLPRWGNFPRPKRSWR